MDFALSYKPRNWQIPNLFLLMVWLTSWHAILISHGAPPLGSTDIQAFGPLSSSDSPDEDLIQSLIQSGFPEMATDICQARKQLALNSQASSDLIARWNMLLIQSLAARAVSNESVFDRPVLIAEALQQASSVVNENEDSSRHLWVRYKFQWGRYFVLQRTLAAYLAVPTREALREWSLQTIRTCLDELDALQQQAKNSPLRTGVTGSKDTITPSQWTSLENDIILLKTDLLLLQGSFYPLKSQERIGAATEILDLLDKAASQINRSWSGYPRLELARCNALFMLGRSQESMDELQKLWSRLTAASGAKSVAIGRWQLGIGALAAQVNRELGNLRESDRWIEQVGGPFQSPEIALEHFANRLVISSNGSKGTTEEIAAQDAQLQLAFQVKAEIGNRFGSYWQQRADALLVSNKSIMEPTDVPAGNPTQPSVAFSSPNLRVELLKTEAKQLLTGGQWMKAIEKLNQAEMSAGNIGNEKEALEIAMKSAAILLNQGQSDVARSEFFRSAIAYQRSPKAPDAAMMSVWKLDGDVPADAGSISEADQLAARQQRVAIYRGRLSEIVATWPESIQANKAVQKLEQSFLFDDKLVSLLELWSNRLKQLPQTVVMSRVGQASWSTYDRAFACYGIISIATRSSWPDRSRYSDQERVEVREALAVLRERIIESTSLNAKPLALAWLDSIDSCLEWPRTLTTGIPKPTGLQDLPLSLGYLEWGEFSEMPTKPESWELGLQIAFSWIRTEVYYQRQIRKPEESEAPAQLAKEVERLQKMQSQNSQAIGQSIGKRQADQLGRSMELYSIAIDFWSGEERREKATHELLNQRRSNPKDAWWFYRSARMLQSSSSLREQAIQLYRSLANGLTAGSDAWLEMRARTAETMRQMGDMKSAQELANLVLATYPNISDEWKRRFAP